MSNDITHILHVNKYLNRNFEGVLVDRRIKYYTYTLTFNAIFLSLNPYYGMTKYRLWTSL